MKRPYLVTDSPKPSEGDVSAISPIEDIIEDARNGRPYILVDAEDRENEGDVIIPAQFATPEQINFMAKHARGLICLSITGDRARQLRLPPMAVDNQSGHGTAFTVSIEAREGVTTGISAHDRAHTIAVAVDPTKGADEIVSPGHVFPLVARDGGVLVRAGHTEAAVDISRLAGLNPAGVICEIMKDDGSMARLPDLIAFAQTHGLKIGTIADLIAYRRRTERQVERVLETPVESAFGGRFRMVIYRNILDRTEHMVLTRGRIEPDRPTLVRMHRLDLAADVIGAGGARSGHVRKALETLAASDAPGVAVFISDSNPAWLSERYGADPAVDHGANVLRDYGVGAQILIDLGVRDMVLLTNSATVLPGSAGYGLRILERRPLD
ncbi:MAG: 3,4-dihydroxy-2-butanone-4-phosphate synthase [Phenylobacterium sp.]|jgi:3,4-dihydroxy 2-butanone 4-phosphate synthase/GTP cyclohydrolase II|uniref:3,4-dihydroxy-2-butanone-4-phosphate synthase n=1 Tax=Phenylobacterium sp. TaxID=1871053 RepID=UPI0025CDDC4A|nr:3,4-dihydroxy-2-butanone-4-phosphate synthase [Phenylobacterium sp.]MCA3710711.1 3,4-dihydroxy-2-butanone-4-phosphate synthase [Phenylobacterium sp.]MCA3713788.1 3,4-dihydroxy-2-butanone-4-phosphate synthase [Phenylobacterium sp.]MCA3715913.1 3,4-dihydroxy-2-butanone-4-phosphate synthase [Phenylobacterium sp.]MCA3724147.1 3,4-dihydroxy-2-butanone-4-phosphate synthase [Phenylobacterium sp.]MCA3727748.1 3,4-dihydroxy-2-butanone-4-phosphate synthase [Phenylobacterium sp.]